MLRLASTLTAVLLLALCASHADTVSTQPSPIAAVSSMATAELSDFEALSPERQKLIRAALELTKLNLTYTFGSSKPSQGGMDCSGTIYYLLQSEGLKETPRQSDEMCAWLQEKTQIIRTDTAREFSDPAFAALKPGDLVFWSGTYNASARKLPITHVMLYIGKRTSDGKPVLFGASDGRSYAGQRRCGVSVFDFAIPKADSKATLYGYGSIPGIK